MEQNVYILLIDICSVPIVYYMYYKLYTYIYTTLMNPFAKVVKDDLLFSLATLVFWYICAVSSYLCTKYYYQCTICVGKVM